jgi:hypothetical protein
MIMWIEEVTVMSLFLGKGAESKVGDIAEGQRILSRGLTGPGCRKKIFVWVSR